MGSAMSRFKSRSEAVLELWDYFYLANAPHPDDEVPWAKIERAMCRLHETAQYLEARHPADVRLQTARRVRNSIRIASRAIAELTHPPEPWILAELAILEAFTTELLASLHPSIVH